MGTTALSVLEQRLSEQLHDYLEVIVTTAINADNLIVSTHLREYDSSRPDFFKNWWVYITDEENITVQRQVAGYDTNTGTLTIRGAVLTDDGDDLATIRLHRYNRDLYVRAINDTSREIKSDLFQYLDVATLVTGNLLPNSHFEDWASSSYPDKYLVSGSGASAAEETTVTYLWGGKKSAKVTRAGTDCYLYTSDVQYPRLLDLMNKTVTFRCWVYASAASQARITLYTNQADGTEQTESSDYHTGGGNLELLEIDSYAINDDITDIEFRFEVKTTNGSVYFDHARVLGYSPREFLLPTAFRDGTLSQVHVQTVGYAEHMCDDLVPRDWDRVYGYEIIDDGTDKHLRLPYLYTISRLVRLMGHAPLSTGTTYTSTIEIDGEQLNLFIPYAKYKLYQAIEGPVASEDVSRYETQSAKAYGEYMRLRSSLRMVPPKHTMRIGGVY